MTDEEVLKFLNEKYEVLVQNMAKRNQPSAGKAGKFRRPTEVAGAANLKGKAGKGKGTRRRSFGSESPNKPLERKSMEVSESEPVLATAEDVAATAAAVAAVLPEEPKADTWDSVVEQPYCEVCEMAFQTLTKLERHVKFSSLHASALAKKKKRQEIQAAPKPTEEELLSSKRKDYKEGEDYKLMYSGSKYYWRSKTDIEFHIYMHIIAHAIEVVPFDIGKGVELKRIYLDRYALNGFVQDEALTHAREKLKQQTQGGRYGTTLSKEEEAVLVEDSTRVLISTHIMARLQADGDSISYVPLSGDPTNTKIVQETTSSTLVPVRVVRRRRTSNEEIGQKMNDLMADQKALAAATSKAEKIADVMQESIGNFGAMLKKRKNKLATQTLSKWQEKWQWACHRVVLQNAVASYAKQWEAYEAKVKRERSQSKVGLAKEV